uniref:Uncharacterized protein n=1 Tax=Rhizophora mucronata TaxID=61149 RepID=A0A2P2P5L7_RHIMU
MLHLNPNFICSRRISALKILTANPTS